MKQTCEDFGSDALQTVALPTCCLLGGEEGERADSSRIKFKVQNWVKFFSCLKFLQSRSILSVNQHTFT